MFTSEELNAKYPMLSEFSTKLKAPARKIIGREKEKIALMSALERPELCNAILLAPAGTGKAHPNDELIPVADERGYIRIGKAKIGDLTFSEEGEPINISGVFPQGKLREYVVHVHNNQMELTSNVRCNDQHLWTVIDTEKENAEPETHTLRELMTMGLKTKLGTPRWSLPDHNAVKRQARTLPIDPFVLGSIIGWGARFVGTNDQLLLPHEHSKTVAEIICAHTNWRYEYQTEFKGYVFFNGDKPVTRVSMCNHPVITSVLTKEAKKRRVPFPFMTSSMEHRSDLVRALTLGKKGSGDETDAAWITDLNRLKRSLTVRGDYIQDVTDTGNDVEMTCIMVDSPTHLYQVTRNYVVTHNTALVQACMMDDPDRTYLEIDMARMISNLNNPEEMAARLKQLFDEAEKYSKSENHQLVLFIDEFHQVVQLSDAAVEALKPLLAASGARGIKVIAATTYDEFNQHIASNLPLVERLARINIPPTNREVTIEILKGMAKRYGVDEEIWSDTLYSQIYEYTNRYVPASVQPRKSIRVLDAMVGRHRYTGEPLDTNLLATVLKIEFDVEVEVNVDARKIKSILDSRVYSQDYATSMIARRLQICVAGLNDPTRPMVSFLFTGSTGVGKEIADYEQVPVIAPDGSVRMKKHGDLVVGDYVPNRKGEPREVLGVFPHRDRNLYRVHLWDGRHLDVGGPHLWAVYTAKQVHQMNLGKRDIEPTVMTTEAIAEANADMVALRTEKDTKFFIPANGAVQWPEAKLAVDPYVLGVCLIDGWFADKTFGLSTIHEGLPRYVASNLKTDYKRQKGDSTFWVFPTDKKIGRNYRLLQAKDVFSVDAQELIDTNPYDTSRRIPKAYMQASIEQRWSLIQGVFDFAGSIKPDNGYALSCTFNTLQLAKDMRWLLHSLGIASVIHKHGSVFKEYTLHVRVDDREKFRFFKRGDLRKIAHEAAHAAVENNIMGPLPVVGIKSIEKLDGLHTTRCIYIDDPEHLYQAGDFIVTHNTEVTKQLSNILFGDDQRHLIRFDMSEWGRDDTVDLFREELARQVWAMSHSIILFDEIEKASPLITRLLLQVLDDGRLSDKDGRQVSFLNTYIVLTTNVASEIFETISEYRPSDTGSEADMSDFQKVIERSILNSAGNRFPAEVLGRVDAIIPFQPLSSETLKKITWNKLKKLRDDVLEKHGVTMRLEKRVLDFLIKDEANMNSNSGGGARGMIRLFNWDVVSAVSEFINAYPDEKEIYVKVEGTMKNEDYHIVKSDAHIKVVAVKRK